MLNFRKKIISKNEYGKFDFKNDQILEDLCKTTALSILLLCYEKI